MCCLPFSVCVWYVCVCYVDEEGGDEASAAAATAEE